MGIIFLSLTCSIFKVHQVTLFTTTKGYVELSLTYQDGAYPTYDGGYPTCTLMPFLLN